MKSRKLISATGEPVSPLVLQRMSSKGSEQFDGVSSKDQQDFDFKKENVDRIAREAAMNVCNHYDRGCTLKCEVCKLFYPCKYCHDLVHTKTAQTRAKEQEASQDSGSQKRGQIRPHRFNPKNVKKVKCNKCGCIQDPRLHCSKCKAKFGEYFCKICCLYDFNAGLGQFHCH